MFSMDVNVIRKSKEDACRIIEDEIGMCKEEVRSRWRKHDGDMNLRDKREAERSFLGREVIRSERRRVNDVREEEALKVL